MARRLLSMAMVMVCGSSLLFATGCVIPLAYEEAPEAPVNAQPVIVAANPRTPGPVILNQAALGTPFSIDIEDEDPGDTLYVRVFRNYQNGPTPFFNNTSVPNDAESGITRRTVSLGVMTWCNDVPGNGTNMVFDVVVADRPFESDLTIVPPYQAVTGGGKTDRDSWVVTCVE